MTSGIDGIYPKGFVVGTVEAVEKSGNSYKQILVRPAVDFSSIEEVLVVLTPTPGSRRGGEQPVKAAGVVIATAVAVALQTTLAQFVVRGAVAVDFVVVAVIYISLTSGPVTGLMAGTFAGLVQDTLASKGSIGIGGLAMSIVGFLVGRRRHAVHRRAAAAAVCRVLRGHRPV